MIWGVGKSEEGETFINITEKFKNISDCLIIPNVLVPKRLLKFSQEEVTRNLFKSYINHKINLQSLIAAAIDPDYITPPTFSNLR